MQITVKKAVIDGVLHSDVLLDTTTHEILGNTRTPEYDFFVPAFIDIHCHGGGGKYVWEDFELVRDIHRENGTSILMASLVTAELAELQESIRYLISFEDLFGIHLEGPYLAEDFCGAHDPNLLRTPDISELQEMLAIGKGKIKMVTIAPELPGAMEAIAFLKSSGVIPAIGHSAAGRDVTEKAINSGAQVVTHLNNGMRKIGTDDSMSDTVLKEDLYLEFIPDLHHLNIETLEIIFKSNPKRAIAITDAMCAAGAFDGTYKIGELPVKVKDGVARLESNNKLAGSTLTMAKAFFNLEEIFGSQIAVQFCTSNAQSLLGIPKRSDYIAISHESVHRL